MGGPGAWRLVTASLLGVLLLAGNPLPRPAAGQTPGTIYQSSQTAFGPITGSGNCSGSLANETPARTLADTLDDAWFASTGKDAVSLATFPTADIGPVSNAYVLAFPTLPVTVEIGKYDISPADAVSTTANSIGTIDVAGGTDPSLLTGTSERMQDCAPKPLSLVSTAEGGPLAQPTPFWNAVGFGADQTTLDSVVFTFSTPVDNFGAWFGDLETRAEDATTGPDDGGALAYIKLYRADGSVLAVQPVVPNNQRAVSADSAPPGDPAFDDDGFGCGDTDQNDDFSSCGNHGTRFLGFSWPTAEIARMQVIVGDDDHCNEVSRCNGLTEHLSFIGPQMAFDNPQVELTKSVINDDDGTLDAAAFVLSLTEDPAGAAIVTEHRDGDVVELTAGVSYEVTEATVGGYELVSIECRDQNDVLLPAVFLASIDQVVDCVVVNNDIPPPTTTLPSTTLPPTTLPSTTLPSTTLPSTTLPSTTLPPTTLPATTAAPSPPTTSAPTTAPTTVGTTTEIAALPVTGNNPNHQLGLAWTLLALGSSMWLYQLGRRPDRLGRRR